PVYRGASSRDVVKVGRDAAPARAAQRKPPPRAAAGSPPVALRLRAGPTGDAAWRVERTPAHASCAPGTRRSGPAREKRAGLVKSRPCAFSARRSPRWEREKGRDYGRIPAPAQEQGPILCAHFDN